MTQNSFKRRQYCFPYVALAIFPKFFHVVLFIQSARLRIRRSSFLPIATALLEPDNKVRATYTCVRKRKAALGVFGDHNCKSSNLYKNTVHYAEKLSKIRTALNSVDFTPPNQRRMIRKSVSQSVTQSIHLCPRVRWYYAPSPIDNDVLLFTIVLRRTSFLRLVLCLVTLFGCKRCAFFLTLFLTGFSVPPIYSTTFEWTLFLQQTNGIHRSIVEEH